jgi:ABC-type phosphate/phosphonate transport system substrate-binding protein
MCADRPEATIDRNSARRAPTPRGALDANLNFPAADPYWASFFAAERCAIESYTDLDALTARLLRHDLDVSYLPAANCFFLRGDKGYRGLASARAACSDAPYQSSVLIVAMSSPAADWHALQGARLGYINTYCTTSYFAPAILLARAGLSLDAFFRAVPVAPWQGQIDAVIAGEIDATMVYEEVWLARRDNAERTRVIARLDDLPTPVFIGRPDEAFVSRLEERLIAFGGRATCGALYAGFSSYQAERMERFFAELARLPGMGKVGARM